MSNQRASITSIFQNSGTALQFVQLFRFGVMFLTGIVLAKMSVPPGLIGVYETLIFIASAVSFFWLNGFMQNLLVQYSNSKSTQSLLQNTFWWLMVFRLAATGLYYLFIFRLYPELAAPPFKDPLLLFGLVVLFAGAAVMSEYVFLLRKQATQMVIYSLVHYSAHLVLVAVAFGVFGFRQGIEYTVYGLLLLNALRFILLLFQLFGKGFLMPQKEILLLILNGATPLIMAAFFSGSVEYISGFMVSGMMNEADFAIYRYGAKELPLTLLLANAFSAALIPQIAEARNKLKEALEPVKKATSNHIKLLYTFCAALMVASPLLYPAVFNADFAASAVIFNIFLLLVISRFVFPQSILLGLGYRQVILQGSILELITAITTGALLGYWYGIVGVAFSVVLASFAEKSFLAYKLYRLENVKPGQYIPLKLWVIFSLLLLILFISLHFFILK